MAKGADPQPRLGLDSRVDQRLGAIVGLTPLLVYPQAGRAHLPLAKGPRIAVRSFGAEQRIAPLHRLETDFLTVVLGE